MHGHGACTAQQSGGTLGSSPREEVSPMNDSWVFSGFDIEPDWRFASDPLAALIQYEAGELNNEEVVSLFQCLVDSDLVWQLQRVHQRTAVQLIDAGLVHI
jgi:hypothetical protein